MGCRARVGLHLRRAANQRGQSPAGKKHPGDHEQRNDDRRNAQAYEFGGGFGGAEPSPGGKTGENAGKLELAQAVGVHLRARHLLGRLRGHRVQCSTQRPKSKTAAGIQKCTSVRMADRTDCDLLRSTGWLIAGKRYHRLLEPPRSGNRVGERIGVKHYDHAHDRRQRYGVPKNETKDTAFAANLIGRRGCDANGLRVNHLAHHAAGAVC